MSPTLRARIEVRAYFLALNGGPGASDVDYWLAAEAIEVFADDVAAMKRRAKLDKRNAAAKLRRSVKRGEVAPFWPAFEALCARTH